MNRYIEDICYSVKINKYKKVVNKIRTSINKYKSLDEHELNSSIIAKIEDLSNKKCENSLKEEEILALIGIVFERVLGVTLHDSQYMGIMVMNKGSILELKTGEGKTFVAVGLAILKALEGRKVHIVTANEYLAKRDCEDTKKIYDFFGISTSYVNANMNKSKKKESYSKDVVYVDNKELAFDYLRSNIEFDLEDKCLNSGDLDFVIIDEIDNIIIDEAKTPIVLSTKDDEEIGDNESLIRANSFVELIKDSNNLYEVDIEKNVVTLSDDGISKVEEFYKIDNYSDISFIEDRYRIHQALHAHLRMNKDIDYVVVDEELILIDGATGRLAKGKIFANGLHQAIQCKEKIKITPQSKILGQITYPNLFRLYNDMVGMSGTVKTEELEFLKNYNKETVLIPTNKPIRRIDKADKVFMTKDEKINAIIDDVKTSYAKGQPVLIGTESISETELISSRLSKEEIEHKVLNAKNHEKESEIISLAGEKFAVTVSTNMAGRGTDIRVSDEVLALGGLKVIGAYRNDNRRIDNQLRGRSGRQGDMGESQFYVSFDDDLIKGFATAELKNIIAMCAKDDVAKDRLLNSSVLLKQIDRAQIKKEGINFNNRQYSYKFDDILNNQRLIIYKERDEILGLAKIDEVVRPMVDYAVDILLSKYFDNKDIIIKDDINLFLDEIKNRWNYDLEIDIKDTSLDDLKLELEKQFAKIYESSDFKIYDKDNNEYKKMCILFNIDKYWMKHLLDLKNLEYLVRFKENPFEEYERESVLLFNKAIENIKVATIFSYLRNLKKSLKGGNIYE